MYPESRFEMATNTPRVSEMTWSKEHQHRVTKEKG